MSATHKTEMGDFSRPYIAFNGPSRRFLYLRVMMYKVMKMNVSALMKQEQTEAGLKIEAI